MSTVELGAVIRGNGELSRSPQPPENDYNSAEYLSWKRLHLSKSKLSNVAEMAGLMAGFAVVATVELQINEDANAPLLTAFAVTTSLLVGTCMTAVIIARCVVPHLESISKTADISKAELSPHDKMIRLIDISWILTNSVSLFLFSLDIIIMGWIKYPFFSKVAPIASTVIMVPVLIIIIIFGLVFYKKIIKHQYSPGKKLEELVEATTQLGFGVSSLPSTSTMSYQGMLTPNLPRENHRQWLQQNRQYQNRPHTRPHFFLPSDSPSPSPLSYGQRTPRRIYQTASANRYNPSPLRVSSNPNLSDSSGNTQIFFGRNHPNPHIQSRSRMIRQDAQESSTPPPLSPTCSNDSVFIA